MNGVNCAVVGFRLFLTFTCFEFFDYQTGLSGPCDYINAGSTTEALATLRRIGRMNEIASDKPQGGWLLLLLVVVAFLFGMHDIVDADVWWHLKAGEWIRANGRVPTVDPFSMHPEPGNWVDLHWGIQVTQSLLTDYVGIWSLTLLEACLAALTCLVLICATGDRRAAVWSSWVVLLAITVLALRWRNRPETISMLFMATTLLAIDRIDRMGPHRLRWFLVAGLLPVVWVNCHSLFLLGLCAGGAFAAGTMLQTLFGTDEEPSIRRQRLWLALMLPVCQFLASLCNPYFLRGTLFPLQLFNRVSGDEADFSEMIGEFRPTLSLFGEALEVHVFLVVCLAGVVSFVKCRRQLRFWRIIVCLGFAFLAFNANRNMVWLTIAIAAFHGQNLRDQLSAVAVETGRAFNVRRRIAITAVVTCLLLFGVASSWWYEFSIDPTKRTGFGIWMDCAPVNATKILKLQPGDVRLYSVGIDHPGWFMWKAGDKVRSFIDPRLEVNDRVYPEWIRMNRRFHDDTDAVLAEMRERGCTHMMLPVGRKSLRLLLDRSDVSLISIDGHGMIFTLKPDLSSPIEPQFPAANPVGRPPELQPIDRLLALVDRRGTRIPTLVKEAAILNDVLNNREMAMPRLLAAAETTPAAPAVWGMLSSNLLEDSKAREEHGSWLAGLRLAQTEYALSRHHLIAILLGKSSAIVEQKLLPSIDPQLHPMVRLACRLQYYEAERQLREALESGLLNESARGPAKELLVLMESDRGVSPSIESPDRRQVQQ